MLIPFLPILALAEKLVPVVVKAIKGRGGKLDGKAGGIVSMIVFALTQVSQFLPGAPAVPPDLGAALAVVIGYAVAWVRFAEKKSK
jgi:hypothetical protein